MPTQSVVVLLCRRNFFLQSALSFCSCPPQSTFSLCANKTWHFASLHRLPWLPAACRLPPCGAGRNPVGLMANFSYCRHKQVYVLRSAGCGGGGDLCRAVYVLLRLGEKRDPKGNCDIHFISLPHFWWEGLQRRLIRTVARLESVKPLISGIGGSFDNG